MSQLKSSSPKIWFLKQRVRSDVWLCVLSDPEPWPQEVGSQILLGDGGGWPRSLFGFPWGHFSYLYKLDVWNPIVSSYMHTVSYEANLNYKDFVS